MELNDHSTNNIDDVITLPLELWQSIVSFLDEIDKIKFGIAVLGFENIIGCPVSILRVINRTTNESSIAKQRAYLYQLWYEALNCFSVDFDKFWGADPSCMLCNNDVWSHLEMSDRLIRVDPTLYQDSLLKNAHVNRIIENLFCVSDEFEEFGEIRYKFTYFNRLAEPEWRGTITLSKSCRHCKISVKRGYDNYCTECNGGGFGIFCGCGLFYCFNDIEDSIYGLCIDCNVMCCKRCAEICDNKCQQVCGRCVHECEICHRGNLCKAHYDLPNFRHRHCLGELKNIPEYGQPAAKK